MKTRKNLSFFFQPVQQAIVVAAIGGDDILILWKMLNSVMKFTNKASDVILIKTHVAT